MDRPQALESLRRIQAQKALWELMKVLKPGEELKWGAKNYGDLVGLVACELALEFEAVTGHPVLELLDAAGACTTEIEAPGPSTLVEVPTIETSPPQPMSAPQPESDALPLT